MIIQSDIQKYMPKLNAVEAEKMASEINLLAGQYGIDRNQIVELLSKDSNELTQMIGKVEAQRQATKIALRDEIFKM